MPITYIKTPCRQCGNNIEFPSSMVGQSVQCPHCHQSTRLSPPVTEDSLQGNATPKQIAYLTYMGVQDALTLTREEASIRIDTLFETDDMREWARMTARQGDWMTDRFLLYPGLYGSEFQSYLDEELAEELHTYVRGRVSGAPERLTKRKIREVVQMLTKNDREWWRKPTRLSFFFENLQIMYPGCCTGRSKVDGN